MTVVEEVRLYFPENKFLVLNNVYFIPGFRRNLISVSKLNEQLFDVFLELKVFLFRRMV